MEVPSVAPAPPSEASLRRGRPAGFMELALLHQPRPSAEMFQNREGIGLFGPDGLGLDDLLDVLNPLQHIPVVSTFYRAMTEDRIAPAPRLLGGALFGGFAGFAVAALNAIVENATGKDVGEHVRVALLGGPEAPAPEPVMVASTAADTAEAAASPEGEGDGRLRQPPTGAEAEVAMAQQGSPPAPPEPGRARGRGGAVPWYLAARPAPRPGAAPSGPTAEPAPPPVRVALASGPGSWYRPAPSAPRLAMAAAPPTLAPASGDASPAGDAAAPSAPPPAAPEPAPVTAAAMPAPEPAQAVSPAVPRLTPAQIELLLASVGKTDAMDRILAQQGGGGLARGTPADAAAPAPASQPGAAGAGPTGLFAERMMDALDKYQNAHGLKGPAEPQVDVVR